MHSWRYLGCHTSKSHGDFIEVFFPTELLVSKVSSKIFVFSPATPPGPTRGLQRGDCASSSNKSHSCVCLASNAICCVCSRGDVFVADGA